MLMDLDVSMRSRSCNYTVHFYGAMFREVSLPYDSMFREVCLLYVSMFREVSLLYDSMFREVSLLYDSIFESITFEEVVKPLRCAIVSGDAGVPDNSQSVSAGIIYDSDGCCAQFDTVSVHYL